MMNTSPLAAELQVMPWPPLYMPPQLPMYDGMSDPKQFLLCYEAIISSYGELNSNGKVICHDSQNVAKPSNLLFGRALSHPSGSLKIFFSPTSRVFRRSSLLHKLCSNVHKSMMNIFRPMSEDFFVFWLKHQACQMTLFMLTRTTSSSDKQRCHTQFWKVNQMRTMYVSGSEIHVHNDYIIGHHHTLFKIKEEIVLYYITMSKTSTESLS
jgi:hypothetical protein